MFPRKLWFNQLVHGCRGVLIGLYKIIAGEAPYKNIILLSMKYNSSLAILTFITLGSLYTQVRLEH